MSKVDIFISTKGYQDGGESLTSGDVNGKSVEQNVASLSGDKSMLTRSVYVNQLANSGISALKSAFNFAKSNYGNFTGDYLGQQKIDNTFSVANTLLSFGSSVFSGAMVGGIPGAMVGAVVGAINIGVNAWQNSVEYNNTITKTNYTSSFNSQRIGIVLTNGNR